jgi:clan AA aspartic protease (TIGR02281 family)
MRKIILQLLAIAVFSALAIGVSSAATVYKCKNTQGKMLYQKTPCAADEQAVNSWTPKTDAKPPAQETEKTKEIIIIKQAANGSYFLEGMVNSHALTFVVDTGANIVALPRSVAASAYLHCNQDVLMETANGRAKACTTMITELKLGKGGLVLKNISAVISPNLSQPLLGMNVLKNFNIEQKNGEMQISEQEAK